LPLEERKKFAFGGWRLSKPTRKYISIAFCREI